MAAMTKKTFALEGLIMDDEEGVLDWGDPRVRYVGYSSERVYQWESPFFEKREADRLLETLNTSMPGYGRYNENRDAYEFQNWPDGEAREYPEDYQGTDYETEDGVKHLYGIGADGCWTWVLPE